MNVIKKYADKYAGLSVPIKASIWFAICNFLQKGISMLTTPIFTRILSTQQYGVFTVYQSWYSLLLIFATLNLPSGAVFPGLTKYEKDRDGFLSSMLGLTMFISLSLFAIYLLGRDYLNRVLGLPTVLMTVMFLEFFFVPAYTIWSAGQRFDFGYRKLATVTITVSVITPIAGMAAVLLSEQKAEARILSNAAVQIVVGAVFCVVLFTKGRTLFRKEYWRYILWFNIPLIPHYLSMSVLSQSDRIMIGNLVGMSEAAIYGIAYSVSMLMSMITGAINSSLTPYTYKAIKEKKYADIGKNVNVILVLMGCLTMLVICFGPEIIRLFAAPEYYSARWVIPPVALSAYFMFLYPLFADVEFYFESNKFIAAASISGAVMNVILNYLFIPVFGYIAAGYTTLFCYIMFVFGHYFFHKQVLKSNLPGVCIYQIRPMIMISVIVTAGVFAIVPVYDYAIARYSVVAAVCLILFLKRDYFIRKMKNIRR